MASGAGECGCGQAAACICSQPAGSLKRAFNQLDGNVALPSLRAVFPNLGDGQRSKVAAPGAGASKPSAGGGLSARLLYRGQSQPAPSTQSGGSSGGHAAAAATAAAAAPHLLNGSVAAPVAAGVGVGAVRPGAPEHRPTTFLDVMSAPPPPGGPSGPGDAAALQSEPLPAFMQLILGTHFMPNSQPRTDGTAPGAGRSRKAQAVSAHAPGQPAGPQPPRVLGAMPSLDFSLKTAARFSSPHSFEWAAFPGAEAQAAGLGAFLGGEAQVHTGEHGQALLARALTSCVFPDAPWPTDVCLALARLDGGRELTQRRSRWCAALRSLYGQLRTCRCDFFYLLHPDGFTAMFAAPGVRVDGACAGSGGCAWVTPTTRGFRQRMRRFGVEFTTPLAPGVDAGASDALEEELAEFERCNPGSTRGLYAPSRLGATNGGGAPGGGMVDNTPRSVCLCAGTLAVHALFNFLHGYVSPDSTKDVPTLLAPVPFLGCALTQLSLVVGTTTRDQAADVAHLGAQKPQGSQVVAATATAATTRQLVHTATVTCPGSLPGIAPWHVARLLALFRDTQRGAFSCRLETQPSTAAFNLAASQPPVVPESQEEDNLCGGAATSTAPRGAYGTGAERDAARGAQALGWPDSVCDALHCADGQFTVPDATGPAPRGAR